MSKNPTEKSPYLSKYGGGYVTPAQYILELVCEKQAWIDKKDLPLKFWQLPEWANIFKRWLRQVYKLLKKYDHLAIINALQDKRSGMRYSLHTKFMLGLIEEHQKKLDKIKLNKATTSSQTNPVKRYTDDQLDDMVDLVRKDQTYKKNKEQPGKKDIVGVLADLDQKENRVK